MTSEAEITNRLKKFVEYKGWSKSAFARAIGVHRQNIDRYLEGKSDLSKIVIKLMTHGINSVWLLTGEGEMLAENGGKVQSHSKGVQTSDNDHLNAVIQRLENVEKQLESKSACQTVQIPLYTHAVSAGMPCTASDDVDQYISVQKSLVKHPASTFAVRASGDSMINAGIEEGDILIADQQLPVKDRCIVIASINGEQTVKRILIQAGAVILAPENHKYPAIPLKETDNVKILGVILGIYRQLY
jgi:DNA polymerase V